MPSILSDADKETVKRTVPKASNKIQAVAVARLYVAYPNRSRWTYTGLQGAAVLSNDTVGNTFWIKLVDISVCTNTPYIGSSRRHAEAPGFRFQVEASFGTKKSTTPSPTTKIEPSFTPSSLRNALPDCRLWTRRKPRSSSRRWMIERRMLPSLRKHNHFGRMRLVGQYLR